MSTLAGTVHVTTTVAADPATCFDVFSRETHLWWRRSPRHRFRADGPNGALHLEPEVGGRVLERLDDGTERVLGEVLAWDPPASLRFVWQLPNERTEVEVSFVAEHDGTRVSITHEGFGALAPARKNLLGVLWSELLNALRVRSHPQSPRLAYLRVGATNLDAFHALLVDPHVRRYLLDGTEVGRDFAEQAARDSDALFRSHGLGLWLLVHEGAPIGFAGFRVFEDLSAAPQLLYALLEAKTGRGLATEAARAMVRFAKDRLSPITAAVDAPNVASLRVLDKLGFVRTGETDGAFGATVLLALDLA